MGGATLLASALPNDASASDAISLPRTTFGTVGLLEMPSARMAPDGQLDISTSFFKDTQRYNFGFQALPWLAVSFRYSGITHFNPRFRTYYDRSFTAKVRLFEEGEYMPAVVVGTRDVIGTGVYGGEYIAATKSVFDDFDATLGIGWGRLASTNTLPNPFGYLFKSFNVRPGINGVGQANIRQLFHGPKVGVFGGVVWRTPIDNLSLIAEYSSDRYQRETERGGFRPRSQFNFGANYQLLDSVQIGLDWLYGRSVGVTVSFEMDPTTDAFPQRIGPAPIAPNLRTSEQQYGALRGLLQDTQKEMYPVVGLTAVNIHPARRSEAIERFVEEVVNSGNRDVALQGTTLVISTDQTAQNQTMMNCRLYARLAAAYGEDIDTIILSGAANRRLRCAVEPVSASALSGLHGIAADTPSPGEGSPRPDQKAVEAAIRRDAAAQSLSVQAIALTDLDATVYFYNGRYRTEAEAVGRLTRVLMKDASPDIEVFHLISMLSNTPAQEYQVLRSSMERDIEQNGGLEDTATTVSIGRPEMETPVLDRALAGTFPKFDWSLYPILRESYFDPDKPVRFAVLGGLSGGIEFLPGLWAETQLEGNIWNDFSSGRGSNSRLPHVRSDWVNYYRNGVNGIARLEASYSFRLAPDTFGVVKAGYLESMFGGGGGEILWRPDDSRFAIGADIYEVWQRNFNRLLGFRKYHVLTGHVTLYYQSPWYGMNFRVHVGRYLAKDIGATFEVTRRFSTGVEIGAFATFTNVPFKKFGEGSFDKGIIIRIPFDWALPISTQSEYAIDLRPLTRDGGQRLLGDAVLYDATQPSSRDEFENHLDQIANP